MCVEDAFVNYAGDEETLISANYLMRDHMIEKFCKHFHWVKNRGFKPQHPNNPIHPYIPKLLIAFYKKNLHTPHRK